MMILGFVTSLIGVAISSKNLGVLRRTKATRTKVAAWTMFGVGVVVFAAGLALIALGSGDHFNV